MANEALVETTNPIGAEAVALPMVIDLPLPITDEFIAELGRRNAKYRFETDGNGRLVVAPGTGFEASGGEAELVRQVGNWNAGADFGFVTSSSGYFRQISDNAVKGPDCTYTSWENLALQLPPEREPQAYEKIAPDVAFELMSPTDDLQTLDTKCRGYVASGIRVAILLIPNEIAVWIYRPTMDPVPVLDITSIAIEPEMPGFRLDARAVFDAAKIRRRR